MTWTFEKQNWHATFTVENKSRKELTDGKVLDGMID
jgi:hypothetical protein